MHKLETLSGKGDSTMRIMSIAIVALFTLITLGSPASARAEGNQRVIITMKAKSTADAHQKVLQALGSMASYKITSNGNSADEFVALVAEVPAAVAAKLGKGSSAAAKRDVMNLIPGVAAGDVLDVEADFTTKWIEAMPSFQGLAFPSMEATMGALPKLNLTSSRAGMTMAALRPEIPWGVERVRAPAAWDYTQGAKVRVAVVDTGIYTEHSDLKGKVDGGYDAFTKTELKANYQDQNGHGTHVAGTIAATKDGKGVVGVAPKARLYAVRVLDADGSGSISGIVDGIIWCANNHIQVANMSLGSDKPSPTLQRALRYAKAMGVVVVAAAGNSGGAVGYPAAYPETIAVAASDSSDKIASFSSRGPEVKFIAPGVSIVSSAMDGGFANFNGTSMAAPHVTGLAALAVAQGWVGLDGPDGVFEQLKKAAKKLPGLTPEEQGNGMIDAGLLTR
ncbi:MAG: S8 family peptidase [Elusimicrobia bacterium]|nr:S8 family peptidase [Elusimicrobiota bacterium]